MNNNTNNFICKYCNSIRKNNNSLINHERLCKLNPNRQILKSNFIEYNNKVNNNLVEKEYSNQYTKAKKLGLPKPVISEETRKKLSEAGKKQEWTEERRLKHSYAMKTAVKKYPASYSSHNVCGRTKLIDYNGFKLNGKWEVEVAKFLDKNNIRWTNNIDEGFEYEFEGNSHTYFPDFHLIDYDLYIEVKGYQRDRDLRKWKDIPKKLLILKKKEIDEIKKDLYRLYLINS